MARNNNLTIEGAKLLFRNFAGHKKDFNPEGRRNFCVLIDPRDVEKLRAEGWNIKMLKPREEGDDPQFIIQVNVRFDNKPPKIVLMTSGGRTMITEDTIDVLDFADIEEADVVLNPYAWERNGKSGVTAYLKTMYVKIAEDDLEKKYSSVAYQVDI